MGSYCRLHICSGKPFRLSDPTMGGNDKLLIFNIPWSCQAFIRNSIYYPDNQLFSGPYSIF